MNRPPFQSALVLTAGLGTRLRPLTLTRAKAAVPVDGEPLVRRVIRWLAAAGMRDLVLNLHHKPETIAAVVGDGSDLGVRVRYSWEPTVLGSAGGPRHALPLLVPSASPSGDVLLVNGDTLTDVNIAALAAAHRGHGALVTLALIPNPRPDKYGGVVVETDGRVTGFTRRGSGVESFHFIGVQAVTPAVFAPLPDNLFSESVLEVYPRLMREQPGSVRGFISNAAFHDIGTPADLLDTSLALAAADGRPHRPRHGTNVTIASSAKVVSSLLWDNVTVGPGATLDHCIAADGVTIASGETLTRSAVVLDETGARIVQPLD